MRVGLHLKPGERGTKKLLRQYGDRLVCVRYRYDEAQRRRLKTVELVVEEVPWAPKPEPAAPVFVRVAYGEADLRRRVKAAGGQWHPDQKLWTLPYARVQGLGLEDRVVEGSIRS